MTSCIQGSHLEIFDDEFVNGSPLSYLKIEAIQMPRVTSEKKIIRNRGEKQCTRGEIPKSALPPNPVRFNLSPGEKTGMVGDLTECLDGHAYQYSNSGRFQVS